MIEEVAVVMVVVVVVVVAAAEAAVATVVGAVVGEGGVGIVVYCFHLLMDFAKACAVL